MRLTETIETPGMFWLPEHPDDRLSGVLKISESGEVTVDLAGLFGDPLVMPERFRSIDNMIGEEAIPELERVVGTIQQGGQITLDQCHRLKSRFSVPDRMATSTIAAGLAFVGAEQGQGEEVLLTEVSYSIEGLGDWLSISGIEIEHANEDPALSIRIQMLDDISLSLPCGDELSFAFSLTLPAIGMHTTEATVKQNAVVRLRPKDPQPIEYFSTVAFKLCSFLTLALDQAVSIQSMTGNLYLEPTDEQKRRRPVKIYGQFPPWPEKKPTIRLHDTLFRYPEVTGQLQTMMFKWFESYEQFKPAFDLYFASRTQPTQFLETKVLWLCQALEAFHRKSSDEAEMSDDEFAVIRKAVLQSCPIDKREWLGYRLRYANELSFRHRINGLLKPLARWFGNTRQRRAFVNSVGDTRNYLTHYDEATTKDRATDSNQMFELYEKLEGLFQLHLLRLIGFDDSSVDSTIEGNRRLRRKLTIPTS